MMKPTTLFRITFLWIIWAAAACGQGGIAPFVDVASSPTPVSTAAATGTPTPAAPVVTGTIRIWHSWEETQVPALLRRIFEFNKAYPAVYFDVLYVPAIDLRLAYEQAAQEGTGPTLLIGQAEWGPDLYDKGYVADLSDSIPSDLLNTLNPAAVGAGRYKEALVSLPVDIRGVVLYRNMSRIGIAPSTFDELVSLAQDAGRGQNHGAVLDRSFFFSGAHLIGLGGKLMNSEGEPAFLDLKGLEWVSLLQAFSEAGPSVFFSDDDLTLFKEGHAGFIVDGTWNRLALADAIGEEYLAIDPWPIHAGGSLSGFVQAESIYLSATALEEPDSVSLKFIQFFLTPDSQSAVAEVGLIPAINGSPVVLAANQIRINDRLISQAMLALSDGVTYPVIPEMRLYSSQLDIALKSIFVDGVPAELALQEAQQAIIDAAATQQP